MRETTLDNGTYHDDIRLRTSCYGKTGDVNNSFLDNPSIRYAPSGQAA